MSASLIDSLRIAGGRVSDEAVYRHAYSGDASHYRLIPNAVLVADDLTTVASALRIADNARQPVTFRSGGTSLSGQASGSGVIIDTRQGFRDIEVLDDGDRLRVQPGVTLRHANVRLAQHRRVLGPDPASEIACTIGGVIANNASGMAAGTDRNTYRTLESMTFVLPSGTVIDSSQPDAEDLLRLHEPRLVAQLEQLRDTVRESPDLAAEIRRRFSMKNTMGYGINAFLDFDSPLDIAVHLLIGSEGTLAFVAEAVFATVAVEPCVGTELLVFESIEDACAALPILVGTGAATLELMDMTSLAVARRLEGAPDEVFGFELAEQAALLVEYRADSDEALRDMIDVGLRAMAQMPILRPVTFARDGASLWTVRKGLYASVAASRPPGTTALLEDIVVPVESLAATCRELGEMLARFKYDDAVIFGHAKDGNLHFMITDDFTRAESAQKLDRFTEEMVELVLAMGGNLKAEHGTGRAMAPYVERQYSAELVAVMRRIKDAFDPHGVLNPGVIFPEESDVHASVLKPAITVDSEVDRCVECGYCEPACPSKDLTLTPRQRIVVRRALESARRSGDRRLVEELESSYVHDGIETCAVDGMCRVACPVGINTGDLVKRLRSERATGPDRRLWLAASRRWSLVTRAASVALSAAARLPYGPVRAVNRAVRRVLGEDRIPLYTPDLPRGGTVRSHIAPDTPPDPVAVYFPSCQGAMFDGGPQDSFQRICAAAGVRVTVPDSIDRLCCGTPWSSKGYTDGHTDMARRVIDELWKTGNGLPVVVDASSCSEGVAAIMRAAEDREVPVIDAISFVVSEALPTLELTPSIGSLTLHPTCSSTAGGINGDLETLAKAIARDVHVPVNWGCCAFAGDRGMLHPDLTASATAAEANEVRAVDADAHASCNRTCEIGISRATGYDYRGILELVAESLGQ